MPDPRRRIAGLLLGAFALLVLAGLVGWWIAHRAPAAPVLPPVTVTVTALDLVAAFEAGGPDVRIVAQDKDAPVLCTPARFEKDAALASDDTHKVIRAQAESAFEVQAGPFRPGARLIARTMEYSPLYKDPEKADPAPVTFRILVDGVERASLRSDYVRQPPPDAENPYDQLLRTLVVPLDAADKLVTLRFETTRSGQAIPPGAVPAQSVWWELRVEHPVDVARQAASPARPNLLVLLVDTLSARHMSLYGSTRTTTPQLAAFAQQGTVFERAIAPASWTLLSVASVLTGLPPNTHGVLGDTRSYLMDALTTWPESLSQAGIAGLGLVANQLIAKGNNFNQGFTDWIQANDENAEQLTTRLLGWIDGQPHGARWFAYVQYMDPHAPYSAPGAARERWTNGYVEKRSFSGSLPGMLQRGEIPPFQPDEKLHIIDLYDGEISYFDTCFGQLRDALAARGLLANTVVVLLADHGEELFEHGQLGHGFTLYGEQLDVPLLFVGPGIAAGVRSALRIGTIGLANTLLTLARVPLLPDAAPPLLPLPPAPAAGADPEPVFSTVRTQVSMPRHSLISAIDAQGRKVIVTLDEHGTFQGVEFFDLAHDGAEAAPLDLAVLSNTERVTWQALQARALYWFAKTAAMRPPGAQPPSPEVEDGMRALGYVGGPRPAKPDDKQQGDGH